MEGFSRGDYYGNWGRNICLQSERAQEKLESWSHMTGWRIKDALWTSCLSTGHRGYLSYEISRCWKTVLYLGGAQVDFFLGHPQDCFPGWMDFTVEKCNSCRGQPYHFSAVLLEISSLTLLWNWETCCGGQIILMVEDHKFSPWLPS